MNSERKNHEDNPAVEGELYVQALVSISLSD